MSETPPSKKPLILHTKTEIFSPPHKYLDGKQVFFTLPRGWAAEDDVYDSEESTRAYGSAQGWVEYWPGLGIRWEISRQGVSFELGLLLEGLGRNPKFRSISADERSGAFLPDQMTLASSPRTSARRGRCAVE